MNRISEGYVDRGRFCFPNGAVAFLMLMLCSCASMVGDEPAASGGADKQDRGDEAEARESLDVAESVPSLPANTHRGICLAHSWEKDGGYGSEASRETLAYLSRINTDAISLTVFGSMPELDSVRIDGEHNGQLSESAETVGRVEEVVRQAKQEGMHLVLKPHLWIEAGGWRGNIEPKGPGDESAWATWWSNYRAFILYYAKMAERLEIDTFVFGVELKSAISAAPDEFRKSVRRVRQVYSGHLTYAANWDETLSVEQWNLFDSVGMQFYPPLSESENPNLSGLKSETFRRLEKWAELAEQVGVPFQLLEVGYKSAPTATQKPYGWPEDLPESKRVADEQLQAKAYRALFSQLSRFDNLRGVYLWKYFADPDNDEGGEVGFSPRGKKAERVLRAAFAPATDNQ